ncbi:hypothetical protein [Stieleria mannarensis]|uniref:hypothetical protein n=1 Tax=Stieleria mannarensis TaxID=2755585 RepID=UPI0016038A0F|nr:hypothetical protein [Rhodopirellula sp. JC639]
MLIRGMGPTTFARAYRAGQRPTPRPRHVFIAVADHFEPERDGASLERQRLRVDRWLTDYPASVDGCCDSRGRPPQHTFFYPIECYTAEHLDKLAKLKRAGYGDVEVHLHHDDDNADSLRELLLRSTRTLHTRHGLLHQDASGQIRYGFIHGNWALDNSHPDGCHCGVNNELTVLRETGCYADFTMPAAPHAAQTRTINSIYDAIDDPQRSKSHDLGTPVTVDSERPAEGLLMIQGPLLVNHRRPWQKPRLENGNVAGSQPLSSHRIDDWLKARVGVAGHPAWQFIKLHTHGAWEANTDQWLGPSAAAFHHGLRETSRRYGFRYYYVTAREMAALVEQARQGRTDPDFDDLSITNQP